MEDEWRPSKLLHYWERPEYWEESWRLEETCCHSDSSEKPSANADVKNSNEWIIIIIIIITIIMQKTRIRPGEWDTKFSGILRYKHIINPDQKIRPCDKYAPSPPPKKENQQCSRLCRSGGPLSKNQRKTKRETSTKILPWETKKVTGIPTERSRKI